MSASYTRLTPALLATDKAIFFRLVFCQTLVFCKVLKSFDTGMLTPFILQVSGLPENEISSIVKLPQSKVFFLAFPSKLFNTSLAINLLPFLGLFLPSHSFFISHNVSDMLSDFPSATSV